MPRSSGSSGLGKGVLSACHHAISAEGSYDIFERSGLPTCLPSNPMPPNLSELALATACSPLAHEVAPGKDLVQPGRHWPDRMKLSWVIHVLGLVWFSKERPRVTGTTRGPLHSQSIRLHQPQVHRMQMSIDRRCRPHEPRRDSNAVLMFR